MMGHQSWCPPRGWGIMAQAQGWIAQLLCKHWGLSVKLLQGKCGSHTVWQARHSPCSKWVWWMGFSAISASIIHNLLQQTPPVINITGSQWRQPVQNKLQRGKEVETLPAPPQTRVCSSCFHVCSSCFHVCSSLRGPGTGDKTTLLLWVYFWDTHLLYSQTRYWQLLGKTTSHNPTGAVLWGPFQKGNIKLR